MLSAQDLLPLSPLMAQLRPYLAREDQPIYLVGGAVRDALLGLTNHDLDFVVGQGAIPLSFRIGNALSAPAYVLDEERDTGRVVLADANTMLDFSRFRGPDLAADLRDRDFTINALALLSTSMRRQEIIDPTGGLPDLAARRLRLTHPGALETDAVRCLRAVRLAASLQFELTPETRTSVRQTAPRVAEITPERTRDELLKMLHNPRSDQAVADLAALDLLPVVLPEIAVLEDVPQSAPHREPVLAHTISVLRWLQAVEDALFGQESAADQALQAAREALAPYRDALQERLQRTLDGGLDGRHVLYLAALFHDAGKAETLSEDEDGRYRFLGHAEKGADLAETRLRALNLSNQVIGQTRRIVAEHMRPLYLVQSLGANPTRRAVYRFFKATGENGPDVGLLALADHLATYDGPGDEESWLTLLSLVATLLASYYEQYAQTVQPPPLLDGRELMAALDLAPGPDVGRLLRLIEEGQAAGEIGSREEALDLAAQHLG